MVLKSRLQRMARLVSGDGQKKLEQSGTGTTDENPSFWGTQLESNLAMVLDITGKAPDLIIRPIATQGSNQKAILLFIDGLTDTEMLGKFVITPLSVFFTSSQDKPVAGELLINVVQNSILTIPTIRRANSVVKTITQLLRGNTVLLLDTCNAALIIEARAFEARSVEEPTLETVIRGPKEGFTERLNTNIALLRRKIVHPGLRLEKMSIGKYSQTIVMVAYIRGVAETGLVDELKQRLERIDIDGLLDSGYIEQLIEDAPFSIFPTIGNTEKPDTVAARLLEGKVAVLVDGTPVALTMPRLFYETLQSPEDYYSRPYNSSIIRMVRLVFLIFSLTLPGLYLAAVNYHPEMLPQTLALTIAAAREGLPFPLLMEILLFGFIFEGLREAGVRLPRPVGQAVTIVGALIIGTAAVDAGLVSSSTVIVTAFVGIAGFITPGLADIFVFSRVVLLLLAGLLGFLGLTLGLMIFYTHMCSLRSFGIPYMSPVAPLAWKELKDIYVRAPLWLLTTRPAYITRANRRRMGQNQVPLPPDPGNKKKTGK